MKSLNLTHILILLLLQNYLHPVSCAFVYKAPTTSPTVRSGGSKTTLIVSTVCSSVGFIVLFIGFICFIRWIRRRKMQQITAAIQKQTLLANQQRAAMLEQGYMQNPGGYNQFMGQNMQNLPNQYAMNYLNNPLGQIPPVQQPKKGIYLPNIPNFL